VSDDRRGDYWDAATPAAAPLMRRDKSRLRDDPLPGDRLPPHSIEAEQGVLGCIVLDPETSLNTCAERLKSGSLMFYDLRHQAIYSAAMALHTERKVVDVITLQSRLRDQGLLDGVGGVPYIAGMGDCTPAAANLSHYLDILREKFALRRVVKLFTEAVARIHTVDAGRDPAAAQQVLMEIAAGVETLTESETEAQEEPLKKVLGRVINDIQSRHYQRGAQQLRGLPLMPPGSYLDKLIRGVRPCHNVVLAARPGGGKTSLAMQVAEYLATDYEWWHDTGARRPAAEGEHGEQPVLEQRKGIPVGVFSIEMDSDSLAERMLFSRAGVDSATFSQGYAKKEDFEKLTRTVKDLAAANIFIDASPAQTSGQIAAKARRMAKQHGVKLFILDYIQLVEIEDGNGFDRVREITKISRKLMALKKQLGVPWIVLAQMNRNIETSEREREPVLSDLKDCGALEQDADVVLFVHKTPRKDVEKDKDGGSDEDLIDRACEKNAWEWSRRPYRVDVIVAKNRFGPMGKCEMVFAKNLQRFEDWHGFKVRHGLEEMKQGERQAVMAAPTPAEELL
jgi:replicative DNA helicase